MTERESSDLQDLVKCPKCEGSGDLYVYDVISRGRRINCDVCGGRGKVSVKIADSYSPPNPNKENYE